MYVSQTLDALITLEMVIIMKNLYLNDNHLAIINTFKNVISI